MQEVVDFLKAAGTYYLATVDGDKPRVRPFGTALVYEGKLYIQTGKVKPVSKQIKTNPHVEICAAMAGKWIRIAAEAVNDDRVEVKEKMLEDYPTLKNLYSATDDNMQVLYLKNAVATFASFTEAPREVKF